MGNTSVQAVQRIRMASSMVHDCQPDILPVGVLERFLTDQVAVAYTQDSLNN